MALRQLWAAAAAPLSQSWGAGKPPTTDCSADQVLPWPDHCSWPAVTCMDCNTLGNTQAGPTQGFYSTSGYFSPCANGRGEKCVRSMFLLQACTPVGHAV